jgi:spermidine synthase
MLATFLVGIALGSGLYALVPRRISRASLFVWLQCLIAVSVLLTVPLFERLPQMYVMMHDRFMHDWRTVQVARFGLAALVMCVPTILLGTLLPTVSALLIDRAGHLGRRLGKAYSYNTAGNVLGAAAAGLLLVPLIGMQRTIVSGAFLNLLAGTAVLLCARKLSWRRRITGTLAGGFATLLIACFLTPWSPAVMNSGVYVYAHRYRQMLERYRRVSAQGGSAPRLSAGRLLTMAMNQYRLLFYETGVNATVAVMEDQEGTRFLTIDGKTDASTGSKSDMKTQVMIGQLPLLFHDEPDEVLIVGLGSGVTAGSVLTHEVRLVDCAEISPAVVKAARLFDEHNHHALDDPRLKIVGRDARNLLLTSEKRYDVIISQPSNPWISGSAGDPIFVARKDNPVRVDYRCLRKRLCEPSVRRDIVRVGLDPELLLFQLFVMNEEEVGSFLYAGLNRPLVYNTDERLHTEFSTPKQLTRRNRLTRFLKPGRLHGDLSSLLTMVKNLDPQALEMLLAAGAAAKELENGLPSPEKHGNGLPAKGTPGNQSRDI